MGDRYWGITFPFCRSVGVELRGQTREREQARLGQGLRDTGRNQGDKVKSGEVLALFFPKEVLFFIL